MDYEKKYKEALERAMFVKENTDSIGAKDVSDVIEYIFSELKESEDERIRKWLIAQLELKSDINNPRDLELMILKTIAWLEKQGEQKSKKEVDNLHNYLYGEKKPADKIEPKFKVGDWIVDNCGYTWKIEGILNQFYILEDVEGGESRPTIEWVDKTCHLWTLKDAKDGDVLCVKYGNDEMPFIFTGKQDDIAYCALNSFGEFVLSMAEWLLYTTVLPATKEQRDLLFSKMKEAGYEWDAEKKELKNIEQNSSWSEEDEENLNQLHKLIIEKAHRDYEIDTDDETLWGKYAILSNWLKSLKERMKGE